MDRQSSDQLLLNLHVDWDYRIQAWDNQIFTYIGPVLLTDKHAFRNVNTGQVWLARYNEITSWIDGVCTEKTR